MSWVAAAVTTGAVASAGSSYLSGKSNAKSAKEAAWASQEATDELTERLDAAAGEVKAFGESYKTALSTLQDSFDPYDMEEAFNSLYEGVIMPMERDFAESTLPAIRAAYSGGIHSASAALSGAAYEAEGSARRDLMEEEASLRNAERGDAITRNYMDYDRSVDILDKGYQADIAAPMLKAQSAQSIYNSQTDSIGASLSADQAKSSVLSSTLNSGLTGALGAASLVKSLGASVAAEDTSATQTNVMSDLSAWQQNNAYGNGSYGGG